MGRWRGLWAVKIDLLPLVRILRMKTRPLACILRVRRRHAPPWADGADFWAVEIDLLVLGEANPDENEAARAHPKGAEAADLLEELRVQGQGRPQLPMVEAVCKANWPAQQRSTEAERATL
ncbi:hypothetical protein BC826DRAFT_1112367 [Russula brevipes]|nr:hypothetical protein BC826DRAFT_1112367 [Russula brevipes]